MRRLILSLLTVASLSAAESKGDAPGRLHAYAEAAVAEIGPLPEDHGLISLPALEYTLRIEPDCAEQGQFVSISVSVADTQMSYDAEDVDGAPVFEASLILPQRQAGPLRVGDFCRTDNGGAITSSSSLHLADVFTAHMSLRCATDDARQAIVYATVPLDVRLVCAVADAADNDPQDQDSSAEDTMRF